MEKAIFLAETDIPVGNEKGIIMDKIYRSGIGFDVHKLVEGRKCIIGGVDIPYEKGLLGHSDADVLLHAISDALLGAAGLGDIGTYFPDTDPAFKGADSLELLRKVGEEVKKPVTRLSISTA